LSSLLSDFALALIYVINNMLVDRVNVLLCGIYFRWPYFVSAIDDSRSDRILE
jgi:hypothetical protein